MKYFQVQAGDTSRNYSQVMFDFGVVIVGPGHIGSLNNNVTAYRDDANMKGEWHKLMWMLEASEGDRALLIRGQSKILAVGEVKSRDGQVIHHSETFSDVDGWWLQHFLYVEWRNIDLNLEGRPLTRSTAQRLHVPSVIAQIETVWKNAEIIPTKYKVSNEAITKVEDDEILMALINEGLKIPDAEKVVETLRQVNMLADWYRRAPEKNPSEHELRSFIVVPLLMALGWSYQKMAIEYQHLDLLLFKDSARKEPYMLIETKIMGTGSENVKEQVKGYLAKKHSLLSGIQRYIVTDGITYWLFNAQTHAPLANMSLRTRYAKTQPTLILKDLFILSNNCCHERGKNN